MTRSVWDVQSRIQEAGMKPFAVVAIVVRSIAAAAVAVCLVASGAEAQDHEDRLGGHFGVLFPLVTHVNGDTVGIGENFQIGFPMGITVKTSDRYAFDLEFVPLLDPRDNAPLLVSLTVHPGILRSFANHWTGGLRMAFDVNAASWGFTPLVNKGFPHGDVTYFIELVVPIRFQDDFLGNTHTSIGLGIHGGIGF
jgi:hypothetical protein